ncbi:MAG: response regulator [Janthinobacterium lividum]
MSMAVCVPTRTQAPAAAQTRDTGQEVSRQDAAGMRVEPVQTRDATLPQTEAPINEAASAMRVIVIDDNQDSASALALLVELWGYDVRVGYDGHTALELAQGFAPHAMLLDIGLPGFSGYDTARCIRQVEAQTHSGPALLVAVTGYGSPDDVARAIRSGFDHHLVKPSDPEVLERFLRNRACRLSTRHAGRDIVQPPPSSCSGLAGNAANEPLKASAKTSDT